MYHDSYDERPQWWKMAAGVASGVVLLSVFAFGRLRSESEPSDANTGVSITGTTISGTSALSRSTSTTSTSSTSAPLRITVTTEARNSTPTTDDTPTTIVGAPGATTSSVAGAPPLVDMSLGYPASPDGSPLPLVVIFDVETITIWGQIPSEAARDRLAALAKANSQFPDAEVVDNMVINRAVPLSVGVRVIELNSARFPEGTADILPAHAVELDRVVAVMKALPNISVVVVGHSDQRGDDIRNFGISDERARAVVNYLLFLGISPTRLSSRAAGESDLLTIADDDAALALNRRTEFIFYGLLIE